MKYQNANTKTKLKENSVKQASLRLLNDIAIIDIDLATKLRPSIVKFVESVEDIAPGTNKEQLLSKLTDFFKLKDKSEKIRWFEQNKDVASTIKKIVDMQNNNSLIDEDDDDFVPGLDVTPDSDDDKDKSLEDIASLTTDFSKRGEATYSQPTLDRLHLETRLRGYIETELTNFLANNVNASTVAEKVEGYDIKYAANGYDDRIDAAFNRVLTVLVDTLLDNF